MFLIQCSEDNSFVIRSNEDVVHEEGVRVGDTVIFVQGGKEYRGKILYISNDDSFLEKKLRKARKAGKEKLAERPAPATVGQRKAVPNRKYIDEQMEKKPSNINKPKINKTSCKESFIARQVKKNVLSQLLDNASDSASDVDAEMKDKIKAEKVLNMKQEQREGKGRQFTSTTVSHKTSDSPTKEQLIEMLRMALQVQKGEQSPPLYKLDIVQPGDAGMGQQAEVPKKDVWSETVILSSTSKKEKPSPSAS